MHIVRQFYRQAEVRLVFPVVRLDGDKMQAVADSFQDTIASEHYTCYACAILPDHVHLVIRKHRHKAEQMIDRFQSDSRLRLSTSLPTNHPVRTLGGWKRFLDTPEDVRTVVRYVEHNPIKSGLPPQRWPCVQAYDGWPIKLR